MKPQLILLGAPGSGKGTQAARLVSELGYEHISTGDLLRKEIKSGSELGHRVQGIMEAGTLVDDHTVLELLNANCDLDNHQYIFDGFPRNYDQSKLLDEEVLKKAASRAVYFDIDLDQLALRLVNRRTCSKCGEIYNLLTKSPKVDGVCDKCGGELVQRKDDNEETVKTRLEVFKETVEPILSYYDESGRLDRLNASQDPDTVFNELKKQTEI